jgi:hypothetical protein
MELNLDAVELRQEPFRVTLAGKEIVFEPTLEAILAVQEIARASDGKIKAGEMDQAILYFTGEAAKPEKDRRFVGLDAKKKLALATAILQWCTAFFRVGASKKNEGSPGSAGSMA